MVTPSDKYVNSLVRKYDDKLPGEPFDKKKIKDLPKVKWGQRKLLITEIDFLTRYYDQYRKNEKKILLYVGASPGMHINYLNYLFPDIHYVLYDKVESLVEQTPNVTFHKKYFDNDEAKKYVGKNLFFMCDIRTLSAGKYLRKMRNSDDEKSDEYIEANEKSREIVFDDMKMQKEWAEIMKPIQSYLKFRISWDTLTTEYFDGDIYFQPWNGIGSIEMRIVPKLNTSKLWNNKKIEEICFYYNLHTRHSDIRGKKHETLLEETILQEYCDKFKLQDITNKDLSLSISIYLLAFVNNGTTKKVDAKYLHDVSTIIR